MNGIQTTKKPLRPTRKQKVILDYIETYIAEHGYSPSYREMKADLNYKSLASVALHVDNLVKRGHLTKRNYSARSVDLVKPNETTKLTTNEIQPSQEKWLIEKVEHAFSQVEDQAEASLDHLVVLLGALRVLGLEAAAQSFTPRLNALKKRQQASV